MREIPPAHLLCVAGPYPNVMGQALGGPGYGLMTHSWDTAGALGVRGGGQGRLTHSWGVVPPALSAPGGSMPVYCGLAMGRGLLSSKSTGPRWFRPAWAGPLRARPLGRSLCGRDLYRRVLSPCQRKEWAFGQCSVPVGSQIEVFMNHTL